jgi:Fe-S cluster assembly protein SufB
VTQTKLEYAQGFSTDVAQNVFALGLSEDVILKISQAKNEPQWLLDWRLKAYDNWLKMTEPHWSTASFPKIDYQKISYFAGPTKPKYNSLDEVDPQILDTFERLGVPLEERKILAGVAVDAIFDSVSVKTTFSAELNKLGIVFCSFSEAVQKYPDLIKKYLGSVVPPTDNFFACLNSAVFSDGSFVYIPKGVKCPMELSSYFRINNANIGQFERTLIIVENSGSVSYLEGCTAPQRPNNQLHGAVVELVALDDAEIKYSTVQNWYPGDEFGNGGIYNFVTKRGLCKGIRSKISWTQVETGSAITWKYPSVILYGDFSEGQFFSVATTNHYQQADTGTKMTHIGKATKSTVIAKGIATGQSSNTYRGKVQITTRAEQAKNYTRCDSLILSHTAKAYTLPLIDCKNDSASISHEATSSSFDQEVLEYLESRGLSNQKAGELIVNGYCKEVLDRLPFEFAVEAKKLLEISLEN